jgi:iron(III) transport system permease protein
LEIAKNLGLTGFQTLCKVVLPLSRPAIFSGLFLVIMEILNEYGAVKYFGVNTFTIGIFRSWNSMNDTGAAIQLSSILLFIVAFLFFTEKYFNQFKRFSFSKNSKINTLNYTSKRNLFLIYMVCLIPIVLAFLIPVLFNVLNVISVFESIDLSRLFSLTFNSFFISLIASIFILIISTYFIYNEKISKSRIYFYINQFISLGYSIPGAVVALSVIIYLTYIDDVFSDINLLGSFTVYFIILIYAYIIRFLAVGKSPIKSSFEKHPDSYDNSAKSLGMSNFKIFQKIYFPINKYSFFIALTLVFIDIMKELPITLILRPFNFDTLATQTYEFAVEEMIPLSSIYSFMIIFICSILLIFLKNFLDKSDVFRS